MTGLDANVKAAVLVFRQKWELLLTRGFSGCSVPVSVTIAPMSTNSTVFRCLPFAVILFLVLLAGCREEPPAAPTIGSRVIVPEAGEGITIAAGERPTLSIMDIDETPRSKAQLPSDYLISQIIDVNLDIDQREEQIIVFKRRDDPSDAIRLLVVDYDPVRSSYVVTWEGRTQANNIRTFTVYTMDVTGDHAIEIVTLGMNNAGRQTLDVFKRTQPTVGSGLRYRSILAIETDASVEITEIDRPDSYSTAMAPGDSFPIIKYEQNRETENMMDLLRTEYRWDRDESRYRVETIAEIPATRTAQAQLSQLYEADAAAFEQYFDGPWYRTQGAFLSDETELLVFDARRRTVLFFNGETQESYNWMSSSKAIYRSGAGLWINMTNRSLTNLRRNVSVSVTEPDTILVTVDRQPHLSGTYRRLSSGLQRSLLRGTERPTRVEHDKLAGLYRNDSGFEIFFSAPRFTLREDGVEHSGGFAVFSAGDTVLELQFLSPTGRALGNRTFAVTLSIDESDNRIVRSLTMIPARLTTRGVETIGGQPIRIEQIEEIETM